MTLREAAWKHRADLEQAEWDDYCERMNEHMAKPGRAPHLNYATIFCAVLLVAWAVSMWMGMR